MITMTVGEFKTRFSEVIDQVTAGEEIAVTYGKTKKIVGYFVPEKTKKAKRTLGILEGKVEVIFKPDFKITTEEFLAL